MELEKCHLLFGCEIMKFFSTGLLLLIVFGSLEGSTIPHKRTVRALNATIQTHFNGTIQRTNPCTNKEVERSSYRGCHEFHHHSKESNWSDYARKCATLISDFFHAISNLVSHKDRQSGTFDLNINTKVSHKTDGDCDQTKKSICTAPTVVVETKDCEVLPVASCDDLPRKATNIKDSETCGTEDADEGDEQEEEKCSDGSEVSVNEEPQTAGSSSFQENDKCSDVSSPSEKVPDVSISEPQPTQEVNPPEITSQSEETIPAYDNYPSSDQTSETANIADSGAPSEAPSTVITSAPINDLYTDADVSPQQSTGSGSEPKEASSDSKDYLSDYNSQTNEEKIEIQPSSFIRESFQTFSPSIQHYSSDTTTSPFEMKSDYDVQDIPEKSQPTNPPQYESVSYDEPSPAVALTPLQPEPENYVNQYDQVPSDLPTSSPPKDEKSVEVSDQLSVYNVRQPQPQAPSSSSLTNEPTSTQLPSVSESQPENYVNYDDGLVSNQLPASLSPPKGEEPSVEYSDQQAAYDVRQPYLEPTTLQPTSSETDNYDSVEDEAESTTSSSSVNAEPSVEVSDELAVYDIRAPTTTYPSPFVSQVESTSSQPSVPSDTQTANYVDYENETADKQSVTSQPPQEPSIEFADQLAVYNVREPLPGTTTPYPLSASSVQPSASQPDNYVSYEDEVVSQQPSSSPSPQHEDIQYLEYSDQLAVYNVREPFSTTTTSSPIVSDDIQSSFSTTLPPSFPSYEYDTYGNQITETEPQSTLAPKLEETSTFQTVASQPQPSNEPVPDYYGEYNDQTVSNQMTTFATPAGNVSPTMMPSSEYIDSNGPQSPSPDYSASQDNGGLVSTSLPSSSDYTSSFNNFEQQYDSQPTSTQLPSVAYPDQIYSDQVSDIREPQSDSSVSDGRISDMVTATTPITKSDSSISYDYDSSLTDTQQVTPTESQPETSVTNEYPASSSSNQPLPNNYETYDEQYSTSENEGPVTSGNEPTATYQPFPIGMITTSPPSTESQNFGDYSAEPQGTYPPKINNESFANYEDNVTSPAGQAYASIEPENDSSEEEASANEEGSSSQEENENFAVSDDQGLLPLYPNTYRPTAQIETTVNYADQTPFRPTRLPSSFGPLQENNIVYDEGIFSNETEPSALGAEEADKSVTVSSEHAKENEGKEFDSSTTLAPQLEFDTYYEETFKQPASSDPPKTTNDYMTYEDDVLPSSPKLDINTTNDYSSSFFPSTPSFSQEMITTPSTTKAMPETYTDYEYSQTDLNSKTTFPPQSESVLYDDHSNQDHSLTQQQQSPDYSSYDYQTQSTSPQQPADQDMIEFSNPETVTKSSSPSLSDLISSDMVTATQPASPAVEPQIYDEQFIQPLSSKDQNIDTYANYEDTTLSQSPITSSPNEVDPSLEYSDQTTVYNVRQPQPEAPSSSSLTNEPTSTPPPSLFESQPENYVNYDDGLVSNQLPTSVSPPKGEEPSVEYSDQQAVYDVPQPNSKPTPSQPHPDNYDSDQNETEVNESTVSSSPNPESSVEYFDDVTIYNVTPQSDENIPTVTFSTLPPSSESVSIQTTSPEVEPESAEEYEDEVVSNDSSTTLSSPQENPSLEVSDELDIYNVGQPSTVSPPSSVSYLYTTSAPPSSVPASQPDNYVSYEDEIVSQQPTTSPSPQHDDIQYLEYSDQLAVYNVREPLSSTTTWSPTVGEDIPVSSVTTPIPSYDYEPEQTVSQSTFEPQYEQMNNETKTTPSAVDSQSDSYEDYEEVVTNIPPSQDIKTPFTNNIVTTVAPSLPSENYDYDSHVEYTDSQTVVPAVRENTLPPVFSSTPATSSSPTETQPENYLNYESGDIPTTLSPSKIVDPFLEYSDQLDVYNVRQPEYYSSSPSPLNDNLVTTTAPNLPSDDYATYDTHTQSKISSESESQVYDDPASSVSQSDAYANYDGQIISNEVPSSPSLELTTQPPSSSMAPTSTKAPFLEYSDELSIYNARQPYSETTPSSPSEFENVSSGSVSVSTLAPYPTRDSFQSYDSPVTSSDYASASSSQLNPESQVTYEDYGVQKEALPSTIPPSEPAKPDYDYQPTSPAQSQDNYVSYDEPTVSNAITTSSPVKEVEPSVEYSDQLAVYNVREPIFSSTPSPVVSENIPSSVITTFSPSTAESESDNDDDYEDETESDATSTTLSTPVQVEYSDELSIYNVRQRPSEMSTIPPLNENIPTFAPSFSSDKSESYDYQPVVFESQPTSPPESGSQMYYEPTSAPSTSSQSQDYYVNYENEVESNKSKTTLRPAVDGESYLEYSDDLTFNNARSPFYPPSSPSPLLNDYTAADTVSTFMPSPVYDEPTLPPSTSPDQQPDSYVNYEDQFPITSSPYNQDPSLTSSDRLSVNISSAQSYSPETYDYGSHVEYSDSQTVVPTESTPQMSFVPTTTGPLTSYQPQPEQYVNYEDESISTPVQTSTSSTSQIEPSVEYSDELAVYDVREPILPSTPSPVVSQNIPSSLVTTLSPSTAESDDDDDYEDETESDATPTTPSTPAQVEYSDELAVYDVREPLISSTPVPIVSGNVPINVISTLQPSSSNLQSDSYNYEDYKEETVSKEPSSQQPTTSPSPQHDDIQYLEYSDQLAVYNVREPLSSTTTWSPTVGEDIPGSSVTTPMPSYDYEPEQTVSQSTFEPQYEQMNNETKTTQSAVNPQPDSYEDYEQVLTNISPSQDIKTPFTNNIVTTVAPSLPSENYDYGSHIEYSDSQTVVPTESTPQMSFVPTTTGPLTSSQPQPEQYVNYEDESISTPVQTSTSSTSQIEPSVEYSDELAVYDVREPIFSSTPSPVISQNIPSSLVTTLSPSTAESESDNDDDYEDETESDATSTTLSTPVQVEYSDELAVYDVREPLISSTPVPIVGGNVPISVVTTLSPSTVESELDNDDDYEDEAVTTLPPMIGDEPSVQLSDELSIYNVRQRPSDLSTPSPFTNNVISNFMTTVSPFFTSSSIDNESFDRNDDDSQGNSDETTETLNSSDDQTNVIQSLPSPDPSNQQYSNNEVESITTVEPSMIPDSSFESSAEQEFDYQSTLPSDYETNEKTVTTPPSSSQPQDNYVVYDDQTVSNAITTSSPVNQIEPSSDYSNQPAGNNSLQPETYSDYEGSTANFDSPPTAYDEPGNPSQVQTSTSQPEIVNYDYYSDQTPKSKESSTSPPTTEIDTHITLTEFGPTLSPDFESQIFKDSESIGQSSSEIQPDNYTDYEDSTVSSSQTSPQPSIEVSNDVAVANVRKPYFEPTTVQPSSSEPKTDDYDTYNDQVAVNEISTPSTLQKVELTVTQPSVTTEGETQMYDEPTSSPTTSSVSQLDDYVNYEDTTVPNQLSSTLSPTVQGEPSVEYSDQLDVYDVREPVFTSTPSPVVSENIPSSVITTLSPSTTESDNDDDYEDETESDATPTTPSTPAQVEYSDELAVYDVREPLIASTPPPVVSGNVPGSVVSTLPPSSSLVIEQISSEPPSDSDDDYEDEAVTTLPPMMGDEPSVQLSDELSIYNVRQRPSDLSTPSPFSNNVISNFMTTISPFFSSSSNDNESSTIQSSETSEPEMEMHDEPNSTSNPSSESVLNNDVDSGEEQTSDEYLTSSTPPTEDQTSWSSATPFQYPGQHSVYNVRQRPSEFSSPSPQIETFSDNAVTTASSISSNDYDSYSIPNDEPKFPPEAEPKSYDPSISTQNPSVSQPENYVNYDDDIVSNDLPTSTTGEPPSIEFSDQLSIYNVGKPSTPSPLPYPSSTQPSIVPEPQPAVYDESVPAQTSSPEAKSDNYDNDQDETEVNESTVSLSPNPESSVEYSDDVTIYNVTPQSDENIPTVTFSTLPPSSESVSIQTTSPEVEPESAEEYEDEVVSNDSSTTLSSPQENPSLEVSDELAIYNVGQPSTVSPPSSVSYLYTTSAPPSSVPASQPDNYVSYEDEIVSQQPTTSPSPQHDDIQYLEYSDQLAVYNVREPLSSTTTWSPTVGEDIPVSSVTTPIPSYDYEPEQTVSQSIFEPQYEQMNNETKTTPSAVDSQSDSYEDYEQVLTTIPPSQDIKTSFTNSIVTTVAPSLPSENYDYDSHVEYSDSQTVVPTESTPQMSFVPTTTGPLTSSQPQTEQYVNYEDESISTPLPTSTSSTAQMEPSLEYSDQLDVYDVREPVFTSTPSPVVSENIPSSLVTTLSPSTAESDDDDDYEDETESDASSTTPSTPAQVEYSDELAVYDVREPLISSTPVPIVSGNVPINVISTLQPSSSNLQSDSYNYEDYKEETVSKEPPTTLSTPTQVEPSVEYSDQLAVYNVRQPEHSSTSPSPLYEDYSYDVVTTVTPSPASGGFQTYDNPAMYTDFQPTSRPQSDSQILNAPTSTPASSSESEIDEYGTYDSSNEAVTSVSPSADADLEYSNELDIYNVRQPSTTSLVPSSQNSVEPEQDDVYTYDDPTQSKTTSSPETETEYDDGPISPTTQPLPETMVTTFQTLKESQITKPENKTSTPSNQQQPSTFAPLHSFFPPNQPSYPLPVENKQQDQVITNQFVNSSFPELDSDKESNNLSDIVRSQDGFENAQRDTPQPEPFAQVPDQTNPSNEPDRMVIRDKL